MARNKADTCCGVLIINKHEGVTSHRIISAIRKLYDTSRVGHTGTLDPMAVGVLPVLIGRAAKASDYLMAENKRYTAEMKLGLTTDTEDITGNILSECSSLPSEAEVKAVCESFVGKISQVPPMYSALKVNGRKLCDLARAGIEVERRPRQVQIYKITIEWIELPRVKMTVHCSKGTYIRTLCHDIGQKLGCGGCMEELLRTRSGIFTVDAAVKLSKIEELADSGRLQEILLPVDRLFFEYPKAAVKAEFQKMLANGNRLPQHAFCIENAAEAAESEPAGLQAAGQILSCETLRVYMEEDFFGIYAWDARRKDYKPVKIFGRENPAGR